MRIHFPLYGLSLLCALTLASASAIASESPPPPPKKGGKEEKVVTQPGLTGAKLLRCDPGFYPSGNNCKPARPGTYVAGGATFPNMCPSGMTSEAKARSAGECFPIGGAPAKPEPEKPKSGH